MPLAFYMNGSSGKCSLNANLFSTLLYTGVFKVKGRPYYTNDNVSERDMKLKRLN